MVRRSCGEAWNDGHAALKRVAAFNRRDGSDRRNRLEPAMLMQIGLILAMAFAAPTQDRTLEERAREIDGKLMAPCCWSGLVSQHDSQVAREIRQQTRQMLAAGKSEQEILDYYVSLYGERILASPRPRGFNLLVWILPWLLLIAGVAFLVFLLRYWMRRKPALAGAGSPGRPLEESIQARIDQELRDLE
jgi:cytochrome c-type biogenesis protein CcmH